MRVEGAGATATEAALATRWVSPGYLDGVHIARTEGRSFALADDGRAPGVAIVNTDLARKYWPGQSAVGRRIQVGADHEWRTVVGVVNDVRHLGPGEPEGPAVYLPYAQRAEPWLTWTWLLARPAQPGADIGAAMRAAVQSVDRELPLSRLGSFAALAARTTAVPRLMAGASMTVAGLTLVLAASGLLALLGLVTRGERHNLVIRSALGAPRRGVLGQPVRLAFGLVGAGWLAGALVALPLRGWLGTMDGAFADGPWWVIAVSALVLLVTAAMAVIGPVRSLARLRPADVLRAR